MVMPAAKKARTEDAGPKRVVPTADDLDEGTPVIYFGTSHGFVRDAYQPLDEFWVTDAETGEIVRDRTGEIVTFKSKDLQLLAATAPPIPFDADGNARSGVLLLGREEHMMQILKIFGHPNIEERRNPQLLLAIPCTECHQEGLQEAASKGPPPEVLELGKLQRPDIHVGARSLQMKQVAEQLGGELLILEGFYVLSGVQLPFALKSCEAKGVTMWERHRRKEICNQIDLCVTASCEHRKSEDPAVAARRALAETCAIEVSDTLWGEAVQVALRRRLSVPDLPLRVKDQSGMEVVVVVLPDDATSVTLNGVVLCFGEPAGSNYLVDPAAAVPGGKPAVGSAAGAASEALADGKIQGKTVREWEVEQREFANEPKVPSGWLRVRSRSTNEVYFFNKQTKEATFSFPEAPLARGWTKEVSKSTGKTYYFHAERRASTFERPTA